MLKISKVQISFFFFYIISTLLIESNALPRNSTIVSKEKPRSSNSIVCPEKWTPYNHVICMRVESAGVKYRGVKDLCSMLDNRATVAIVRFHRQNKILGKIIEQGDKYEGDYCAWIGLIYKRVGSKRKLVWEDDSIVKYENFAAGENNKQGTYCVCVKNDGLWYTRDCSSLQDVACQIGDADDRFKAQFVHKPVPGAIMEMPQSETGELQKIEGLCTKPTYKSCRLFCTFETCRDTCKQDEKCLSFSYRFLFYNRDCLMYRETCYTSDIVIRQQPNAWATYSKLENIARSQKLFRSEVTSCEKYKSYHGACRQPGTLSFCRKCKTIEDCANKCTSIPDCVGFLYQFGNNICWPKDVMCKVGDANFVDQVEKGWEDVRFFSRYHVPSVGGSSKRRVKSASQG